MSLLQLVVGEETVQVGLEESQKNRENPTQDRSALNQQA